MDKKQLNLERSVLYFLKDVLHLKRGETLLLYSDKSSDMALVENICSLADKAGGKAEMFELNPSLDPSAMERTLSNKINSGNYAAVCELSGKYFYNTPVWATAVRKGCRVFSLGDIDSEFFVRCIGQVDKLTIHQFGLELYQLLEKAQTIRIRSAIGTDIKLQMGAFKPIRKVLSRFKLTQRSKVWPPCGWLNKRGGDATFMAGQVSFIGLPGTIEGKAVIDGYFWPPEELGPLDHPVTLNIRNGMVESICGGNNASEILTNWFEGKAKNIEHFSIGFNPGAGLAGRILVAERTFGSLVIGIGGHPFHGDGIIVGPEIEIDGTTVLQNSTFIREPLSRLAQHLRSGQ